MPTPLIQSLAKKANVAIEDIEKLWNEIKNDLIQNGKNEKDDNFYAYLVSILKKRLKITEEIKSFTDFIKK